MLGIRQKLTLGSGGLLAFLLLLGALSLVLLNRYSRTIEQTFRDNYDSVMYGQQMKDAIDSLDDAAQHALWGGGDAWDATAVNNAMRDFERSLRLEQANVTVPHEGTTAQDIADAWQEYRQRLHESFPQASTSLSRAEAYRRYLQPQGAALKKLSQSIIDLNMTNIVSVDGKVKENIAKARQVMYAILLAGIGVAMAFIAISVRSILRPLRLFTASAREIARGNLDLSVTVYTKDEFGELAAAFNSMASRLREFRSSDRAKLYRTQRTTQMALDSFPDAVAVVGIDGKVELANQKARQRFGLEPGSDLAKTEPKTLWNMFQTAFATMAPVSSRGYENVIQVFEQGQEQFYLPQAVPIVDDNKTLVGATMVLANVTHLRRMDEMKSGLLSVVSHELKTPLTSLRMTNHLLLDERAGPLTPKQVELLVGAREDTERLNTIIENLLDLGRMEAGRALIDLRPQSCESLLAEAIDPFYAAYRNRGVSLQTHMENDPPPVLVDKTRINHVFSNLLGNALNYTPSGGRVDISLVPAGEFAEIRVADTGIGIPPEYHLKIFERFFRVPGSLAAKGAGLGLAIAREIVEAHGGKLWLESSHPGTGSTFVFTLRFAGAPGTAAAFT